MSSDESNWDMALNKNRRADDSDRPASESSEFLDDVIRDLRSVATAGYRENIRAIVFKVNKNNSWNISNDLKNLTGGNFKASQVVVYLWVFLLRLSLDKSRNSTQKTKGASSEILTLYLASLYTQ